MDDQKTPKVGGRPGVPQVNSSCVPEANPGFLNRHSGLQTQTIEDINVTAQYIVCGKMGSYRANTSECDFQSSVGVEPAGADSGRLLRGKNEDNRRCLFLMLNTLLGRAQTANSAFFIAPAGAAFSAPAPGVLTNDGGRLTANLASGPTHGTVTLNADGSFVHNPASNFTGIDGFTRQSSNRSQTSSAAPADIMVLAPGELFYDNVRPASLSSNSTGC